VQQGSYLSVAIDGSTKLQKYTVANLSNMQKEEFESTDKKSDKSTDKKSDKSTDKKKDGSKPKQIINKDSSDSSYTPKTTIDTDVTSVVTSTLIEPSDTPAPSDIAPDDTAPVDNTAPDDTISDIISGSNVDYQGSYTGTNFDGPDLKNRKDINGVASMNVNFNANSATLTLDKQAGAYDPEVAGETQFNMTITGDTLSGTEAAIYNIGI
jgi:hypothetical protein